MGEGNLPLTFGVKMIFILVLILFDLNNKNVDIPGWLYATFTLLTLIGYFINYTLRD